MNLARVYPSRKIVAFSGFSLIELMVVVAIVGILAAIAYSSYSAYTIRQNRSVAQTHLMDVAQRQQQYLLDKRSYAAALSDLNVITPSKVSDFYTIALTAIGGSPPGFTATATPITGTIQANDGVLSITHTGIKFPADKW